jgi:hypothetical protein
MEDLLLVLGGMLQLAEAAHGFGSLCLVLVRWVGRLGPHRPDPPRALTLVRATDPLLHWEVGASPSGQRPRCLPL